MKEEMVMKVLEMLLNGESKESGNTELSKYVGKNIFVQTVTHYYTGKVLSADNSFITLEKAAWIADSGRLSEMLVNIDKINEIEMFTNNKDISVGVGAIICITEIDTLPTNTK